LPKAKELFYKQTPQQPTLMRFVSFARNNMLFFLQRLITSYLRNVKKPGIILRRLGRLIN
jgi:hypothetical protein